MVERCVGDSQDGLAGSCSGHAGCVLCRDREWNERDDKCMMVMVRCR